MKVINRNVNMTQSDRKSKLGVSQRYRMILESDSRSMHNNDAKQYAEFLHEQERMLGPGGFVDSKKYINSYMMKSRAICSKSLPILNGQHQHTLLDSSTKKAKNLEGYDQRAKLIESSISQHKKEERALRRSLGDAQRHQQNLQRMITDYENVVRKKTSDNEREMNDLQVQQEKRKQQFLHEQEHVTRDNILQTRQDSQSTRDHQRKYARSLTHLEVRYTQVLLEMQKRRAEIERLLREYEEKLKQKENEEVLLRKELTQLAHSVNTEEQREARFKNDFKRYEDAKRQKYIQEKQHQRSTFENKQLEKDQQFKALEAARQKLNADIDVMKEYLNKKSDRESRKIVDITNQLIQNADTQRQIIQEYASLSGQTVKRTLKTPSIEKLAQLQLVAKEHAGILQASKEERKHTLEKSMEYFQKVVSSAKEAEKNVFRDMRTCENLWIKQDKLVNKLQENLTKLRRENTSQMRKAVSEGKMKERDLQWQLSKAYGDLAMYQNQKNKSYEKVLKHRTQLQEDRHLLTETEKEYARLNKIKERSQALQQTSDSYTEHL